MRRLLVPVRDDQTVSAVERHLAMLSPHDDLHVVVLSVQPKPDLWQTRGLFQEAIKSQLIERGRSSCDLLVKRLTATGISCEARVQLGDDYAEILRCTRDMGCSEIVLLAGPPGWAHNAMPRVLGCIFGSTANRLVHASPVPVTVVH